MNKILISVVLLVLFLGLALMVFSGSTNIKQPQLLGGTDFILAYQKTSGGSLLDVRTPGEFGAGHLQGASNIDFENPSFISEIQKLDKTKSYFLYCRSGNRSGQAVAMMQEQGFQNVYDLRGGIVANQNSLTLVGDTLQ